MESPGFFYRPKHSSYFLFFACLAGWIFLPSLLAAGQRETMTLNMKKLLVEYMKFPEKMRAVEKILEQDASATELMKPILVFGQTATASQTSSQIASQTASQIASQTATQPAPAAPKANPQGESERQIKTLIEFMGKTFQKRLELLEKFKEMLLSNVQKAIQKVGEKHQSPIIINTSPLSSREVEQILLNGLGSASLSVPGGFPAPGMQAQPPNGFMPPTMMGGGGLNSPGGMPNMRGPFGFGETEKKTDLSFFSQSVIFSTAPDLTEEVLQVLKEGK